MPRLVILAVFAVLLATPAMAQTGARPGLGDDPGVPETTPFHLPAGLSLAGPVWAVDADGGSCAGADASFGVPDGGVKACVPLKNTSGTGIHLALQPGLILLARHQEGQHGMLLERIRVTVPAESSGGCNPDVLRKQAVEKECEPENGDPDSVFVLELTMNCLNASRSPSFAGMPYDLGGVIKDPDLLALAELLSTKDLSGEEARQLATDAIYEITEGTGLRPETRRRIDALPPKRP